MSKKTTTVVEEDVPPEVPPTDEHDNKVADALVQKDAPLTIEADKLDEKLETPKEEIKAEEKTSEPPIDKEALKAEVTKEVKDSIVSQLQGTKEEKKDAYKEFEKSVWEKDKRTPTYQEALDFVKIQAKEEIKAELNAEIEEENKQKADVQKAQEEEQQKINDTLNKDWDEQLDDLVKVGRIPKIVDPNDNRVQIIKNTEGKEIERIPIDPGKRARYELFKSMYSVSEERIQNGLKPLTNLKEIYYEHYTTNKQPEGANAPIAGVRRSVSQDNGTSFKYHDVHNKSMEELLQETR